MYSKVRVGGALGWSDVGIQRRESKKAVAAAVSKAPQVGSPCVDAGDQTLPNVGTTDLTGRTRILLGEVDMGCHEARTLAHHPAAAGMAGAAGANGPFDLLKINGSAGGVDRRVTVGVGSSSVVTMDTPPTGVASANFVIFGLLGEADVETAIQLPYGIGEMMFAPQPMVPAFLHWLFFTYTDNFNPAAPQFTGSTPTAWSSGLGPAIPLPLTLTLQGVIEEAPGVYVPTNAVLFEVQ